MSHHDEELFAELARMALAGDGVVLGVGLGILAVRTWLKFRSHSIALKQVHDTPVTRIADLRSLVQDKENKENRSDQDSDKSFPDSRQLEVFSGDLVAGRPSPKLAAKHASKLVIVRGRVYPSTTVQLTGTTEQPDGLVAQNGAEKGVFLERTQTVMT